MKGERSKMAPRPGRVAKVIRGTGTTFIVLGTLILYFVLYELVGTSLQTHAHQNSLKHEFAAMLDDPRTVPSATSSPTTSASPAPAAAKVKIDGIAELIIPKIGIDDIVVEGTSLDDLAYGPGHYSDSAPIGAAGTAAIAGHRTGWGSPFYNLDGLTTGDVISLKTTAGTYDYRVTRGNVVVQPDDYWVVQGDPQSKAAKKLTLTTCTPRYTSRNRLIVWADFVSFAPRTT